MTRPTLQQTLRGDRASRLAVAAGAVFSAGLIALGAVDAWNDWRNLLAHGDRPGLVHELVTLHSPR